MNEPTKNLSENTVFALDIGTRSIIGIVGVVENDKLKVIAIEREDHTKRAMIDGQIEDIDQVAKLAQIVKERLEIKLKCKLTRVCVAAAGRALKTQKASYELELPNAQKIDQETISRLEAGAIGEAEAAFNGTEDSETRRQFFLVGYSVLQYYLDNYLMSSLKDHHGKKLKAEVIATFLPSEVVESLYTTMNKIGLEIASLTLEPIAAINAAIPQDLRLLNLVLVDIGAGTSDIAACRDGGIIGYTMATLAGDEITETLMKHYLIDFATAEKIKFEISDKEELNFMDVLGFEQTVTRDEIFDCIQESSMSLCKEISERIAEVNNGAPSAVFLAGGGSKLTGIREGVAEFLKMDLKRVAIAGNNFQINAFSNEFDLNNPEFATPLGIAISAGLNLINDSFRVTLNGKQAKLFRSGSLTILDILMMNGYGYQDLLGHSGSNITVWINGKRKLVYGGRAMPAVLRMNGSEAKVSDIVHAGDTIEFLPASHGKPAHAILSDVISDKEASVTVNGEPVSWETELKQGDIILTEDYIKEQKAAKQDDELGSLILTDEDLSYSLESEEDSMKDVFTKEELTNEAPKAFHQANHLASLEAAASVEPAAETVTYITSENKLTGIPKKLLKSAANAAMNHTDNSYHTISESNVPVSSDTVGAVPVSTNTVRTIPPNPTPAGTVSSTALSDTASVNAASVNADSEGQAKPAPGSTFITLNEKPLFLPAKPNQNPYYLMDVLEYSGLDFDNIKGKVIMKVNGEDGSFLQELRSNDVISITCE